ncbi:hypothetical protein HY768_07480 [candidate division TA06 bacterium]|uniref:Uncharacterized protein n=1 Tax=candidate division TA06 bacterium TaxID=2250710 RepID=A0A933IB75_UNCT6|nr:hypothetical protein [candidate division TA06 bacterium]
MASEWNNLVIKLKPDFARRRDPLRALPSSGWGFDTTGVEKSKLSNDPDAYIMRDKTTKKLMIKRKGETEFKPMEEVNYPAVPIMKIKLLRFYLTNIIFLCYL